MLTWFSGLDGWSQGFLVIAIIASLFFIWQFIGALIGLGEAGGDFDLPDADVSGGMDIGHGDAGHADLEAGSFQILSLRAVVAFLTMGGWAGFLHHELGQSGVASSIVLAVLWGVAGAVVVAVLVSWLSKLQETPRRNLAACIGQEGTVYMDIPAQGYGQIRILVDGTISFIRARHVLDETLPGGTGIRILTLVDPNTVEVERIASPAKDLHQ